jgi:hypothetical protein
LAKRGVVLTLVFAALIGHSVIDVAPSVSRFSVPGH